MSGALGGKTEPVEKIFRDNRRGNEFLRIMVSIKVTAIVVGLQGRWPELEDMFQIMLLC